MSSNAYSVDLGDQLFTLFEQHRAHEVLAAYEAYEGMDQELITSALEEAKRIAEDVLGPVNRIGDHEGVQFDGEGNVTTPDCFNEAWQVMAEGGWIGVDAPVDAGGMGLPHAVNAVTHEVFSGAATAFMMYPGLTAAAARVVFGFAPDALKELVATKMFTGEWGGTMCLTEAGAGSDVGSNRAKAEPTDEDGVYLLEGEKIFISGADQDLTENIVHLVLARLPDAPAGTRGLSIFLVPKFWFDGEGTLGERNGAWVSGIEEKMGIHGSATCTLLLGDRGPCKGWIVGEPGQGMSLMFHMMNEARVGVAIQGLALAAHAYGNALGYTSERKQGVPVTKLRDKDAEAAPIQAHPDVRRMLMLQKCQVEAMRSVTIELGLLRDIATHDADEAKRTAAAERIDLLTPVAKAHFTDLGFDLSAVAVQCFGGYGFIQEYPVEQHVRDAKICTIYEGTNGIQAMDLLGRKLRLRGGQVFMDWLGTAQAAAAKGREAGFDAQAEAIEKALGQLGATAMHLAGLGGSGKLDAAMLQATPFLRMFGIVLLGVASLDQAVAAAGGPRAKQKLANLRFYVAQVLPAATGIGKGIQSDDGAALEEGIFDLLA